MVPDIVNYNVSEVKGRLQVVNGSLEFHLGIRPLPDLVDKKKFPTRVLVRVSQPLEETNYTLVYILISKGGRGAKKPTWVMKFTNCPPTNRMKMARMTEKLFGTPIQRRLTVRLGVPIVRPLYHPVPVGPYLGTVRWTDDHALYVYQKTSLSLVQTESRR